MEWQDIGTAPKDGSRLLGAFHFPIDKSLQIVGTIVWQEEFFRGAKPCWCWEATQDTFFVEPTHWMPLPAPPQEQDK